jgi:hypothetical protein
LDEAEENALQWPPKPEDLRRLYVDERLSAARIAARYGLQYASPKTAESTVLYHLRKNGIVRRDKAEHARKVTDEMVDLWVRRYEAGEPLKQIAEDRFSPVTVFLHLKKRGVKLRDKVDAQIKAVTKHKRLPFTGDEAERAYLLGFTWGDCAIERHGRAVRVKSGTTHPDFVALFKNLFGNHGNLRSYPKEARLVPAELNLEIDLDGSFEFLLMKKSKGYAPNLKNRTTTLNFTAGFFDAEGCIAFNKSRFEFQLQISNTDEQLMRSLQSGLERIAYHPRLYSSIDRNPRVGSKPECHMWRLSVHNEEEIVRLLKEMPLRHTEKTTKAALALSYISNKSRMDSEGYPQGWREYGASIKAGTKEFIRQAAAALKEK